jgi:6-phosphogluconolactonase
MLPEIIVDTPQNLAEWLAGRVEAEARMAIDARGRFSLALPGGSVAEAFFPRLARANVDWRRADFFWCDERAVPADDPESNYKLARTLWLDPAQVPPQSVHRMVADVSHLEQSAAAYADEMVRVLGTPPRIDVALLGVGPDGHVCSLFPNHPLLREERRWVGALDDSPKPPLARLTLTLPALAAARLIVVAAFGHGKASVVGAALEDRSDSSLPLALVLKRAHNAIALLDRPAATEISQLALR